LQLKTEAESFLQTTASPRLITELAMLRIVGIQRSEDVQNEFVLLQNHSSMRVHLRSHVVMADAYIEGKCPEAIHAFREEELIHSGAYVMLCSGSGISRWAKTKDMSLVFFCYMGRESTAWCEASGPISILSSQHSYEERQVPFAELV
jgi:hypothetical protein